MADVIWKPVPDYEGLYEVSNTGEVRRVAHQIVVGSTKPHLPEREKILQKNKNGYLIVALYKGQSQKHVSVHRLVATVFLDNPDNLPQVNHIDENKENNHVSNLEWCTNQYNSSYGTRGKRIGAANTNGKQSHPIVAKCGNDVLQFPSIAEASRATGICRENIIAVLKNRRNIAGGYKWEYLF